ncbi:MAG: AraC family transcriptional regulator [Spirochaetales bacterium]|nr:AraC family transcriptional regulator [Spirochaetales bacterium]
MEQEIRFHQIASPGDGLVISRHTLEDEKLSPHRHDFIEIAYIESGQGLHLISGYKYPVRAGDLCIINMKTTHGLVNTDTEHPLIVINCIIAEDYLCRCLKTMQHAPEATADEGLLTKELEDRLLTHNYNRLEDERLKGNSDMTAGNLIRFMLREYERKMPGHNLVLSAYFQSLLLLILRQYRNSRSRREDHRAAVFRKAYEFMQINADRSGLKISDIAAWCSVSDRYLEKIFRQEEQCTPLHSLQKIRMEKARKLILETDRSIRNIALSIGYLDTGFFYRIFKRTYGCLPGDLRKSSEMATHSSQLKIDA